MSNECYQAGRGVEVELQMGGSKKFPTCKSCIEGSAKREGQGKSGKTVFYCPLSPFGQNLCNGFVGKSSGKVRVDIVSS